MIRTTRLIKFQLPFLTSGHLMEKLMYTYLNKQQAESVLCIGMYTKLTGRRVQVTWPLKLQRVFCYMTAGKHSSRIDIPSFQLHLEINLHKMTDPGLNIPALKNESFTSRNMTETMYISFSLKTCSCKWYIQRLIREALSICFECDLRVFVCLFVFIPFQKGSFLARFLESCYQHSLVIPWSWQCAFPVAKKAEN